MASIEHYDCKKPHRVGTTGRTKHFATCKIAQGHDSGTTLRCRACHKGYYKKHYVSDERLAKIVAGYRRTRNHPHYDCDLQPSAHPILQGIGSNHRGGCHVAKGHTQGLSAGNDCAACAKHNRRKRTLRDTYELTLEDYDRMLESQHGRCAICRQAPAEKLLSIDHDHSSGKVRGLLCSACNFAIGTFNDDPKRIKRAARYLEKHMGPA